MDNTLLLPRIASHVQRYLTQHRRYDSYPHALDRVVGNLTEVARLTKRLRTCRNRSWAVAERHQRRVLSQRLSELEAATSHLKADLATPAVTAPTLRSVLEDLQELACEFDDLRYDRQEAFIAVTTEPITLEGIALGRFELRLFLSSLSAGEPASALFAIALDPNPCASDDAVTHPHVSGEHVCLGDALLPFQSAVTSGRLADALQIVRVVLNNYNPSSPFCAMESWYGVSCHDCGYMTGSDSYFSCENCENAFCDECYSACAACGESSCRDCMSSCALCDEGACSGCIGYCAQCDQSACANCLDEGLCPTCVDARDDEENENNEATEDQVEAQESATPQPALASA